VGIGEHFQWTYTHVVAPRTGGSADGDASARGGSGVPENWSRIHPTLIVVIVVVVIVVVVCAHRSHHAVVARASPTHVCVP
jgi:hypothetical protein